MKEMIVTETNQCDLIYAIQSNIMPGQSLQHVTKFRNHRGKIVKNREFPVDPWSIDQADPESPNRTQVTLIYTFPKQ